MHVGWSLLVAVVAVRVFRRRALRVLFAAHPVLMTVAVTATENHFLIDALVGAAVALVGYAIVSCRALRLVARIRSVSTLDSPTGLLSASWAFAHPRAMYAAPRQEATRMVHNRAVVELDRLRVEFDDCLLLRAGRTGIVTGHRVMAPSTLGDPTRWIQAQIGGVGGGRRQRPSVTRFGDG